jgi:hypothetical protein
MQRSRVDCRRVPEVFHAYTAAIGACDRSGQKGAALGLLPRMRDLGLAPGIESFNAAVLACRHGGDREAAHELIYRLRAARLRPDAWTFNALLEVYGARGGMGHEALALLRETPP